MTARRLRWAASAVLTLWGIAASLGGAAPCAAQGTPASSPAVARMTPVEAALQRTRQTGEPTLVLVTSRSDPATQDLWRSLVQGHATWTRGRAVLLTQILIEDLGQRAQ